MVMLGGIASSFSNKWRMLSKYLKWPILESNVFFIFDQSSEHTSLPPDALKAFEMNKSDGGKQCIKWDTTIPNTNPSVEHCGKPQKMTLSNSQPKGLQQALEEQEFVIKGLCTKCSPICPIESKNCCLARLLSQQNDFKNQPSMLETFIKGQGHEYIFLLKFHYELNSIEMVYNVQYLMLNTNLRLLQYWGWCKYRYREEDKKTI